MAEQESSFSSSELYPPRSGPMQGTSDCMRVQRHVLDLAALLRSPGAAVNPVLRQRCQTEVGRAREELAEHHARIAGPSGLFQYLEESAPHLTGDVSLLCEQHCGLDRCLAELEEALVAAGNLATDMAAA